MGNDINMGSTIDHGDESNEAFPNNTWHSPIAIASFSRTNTSQKNATENPDSIPATTPALVIRFRYNALI